MPVLFGAMLMVGAIVGLLFLSWVLWARYMTYVEHMNENTTKR